MEKSNSASANPGRSPGGGVLVVFSCQEKHNVSLTAKNTSTSKLENTALIIPKNLPGNKPDLGIFIGIYFCLSPLEVARTHQANEQPVIGVVSTET